MLSIVHLSLWVNIVLHWVDNNFIARNENEPNGEKTMTIKFYEMHLHYFHWLLLDVLFKWFGFASWFSKWRTLEKLWNGHSTVFFFFWITHIVKPYTYSVFYNHISIRKSNHWTLILFSFIFFTASADIDACKCTSLINLPTLTIRFGSETHLYEMNT